MVVIDFEEFLKALLENWIAERGGHDVETSCHFYAGLHLDDTDLINCSAEDIQDDACSLCTLSTFCVEFDGRLQMHGVRVIPLDVKMRANVFLELFVNDLAWADCDGTTKEVDDAGATIGTTDNLKHTDGDI